MSQNSPKSYASYPSLKGQRALVTGGATGIGAAIVRGLAAQGCTVFFVDIADEEGAALAAVTGATYASCDVRDIAKLRQTIAEFGEVDILVNNVANDTRHAWRDLTPEDWDNGLAINLRPAFFAIQAVADGMISRGHGAVINFGSISWKVKHGGMPAYTAAKAAVHGLTRSFVNELGAARVRINTVVPGWVLTERQRREHFGEDGQDILNAAQPLRGEITSQDAAALVLFLASDDGAMCTGQEFTIDGGWC